MPDGRVRTQSDHRCESQSNSRTVRDRKASRSTDPSPPRARSTIASRSSGSCGTRNGQMSSRPRNCFARNSSASSTRSRPCRSANSTDQDYRASSTTYNSFLVTLSPGARLGAYEIIGPIGAGGMGEVYRARDTRLDRDVAIKMLPESLTSNPDRLRRFEQEARAAAALNHPNILAVYQMGTQDGVSFLVSELLEGETVRERLRRGPVAFGKTIDYAVQIAHGLAAPHEKGIVHRDPKPETIFLTNH